MPEASRPARKKGDTAHFEAVADLEALRAFHNRNMAEALKDPEKIPNFLMSQALATLTSVEELKIMVKSERDHCEGVCKVELNRRFEETNSNVRKLLGFRARLKGMFGAVAFLTGLVGLVLLAYEAMTKWMR